MPGEGFGHEVVHVAEMPLKFALGAGHAAFTAAEVMLHRDPVTLNAERAIKDTKADLKYHLIGDIPPGF